MLTFDKKRLNDVKALVKDFPEDLVEFKGDKLHLKDNSKVPILETYLEKSDDQIITITKDPTKLTFTFETDGSMSAKEALVESSAILLKKYEEFGKLLKDL